MFAKVKDLKFAWMSHIIKLPEGSVNKGFLNLQIKSVVRGLPLKKRYIMNAWGPIPLKLNRELRQWWKCNKVVFSLIDCASLRCCELPKLRLCKTALRVQVFSSWRRRHFLILPLIGQLKLYCVTTEADYRISGSIESCKLLNE